MRPAATLRCSKCKRSFEVLEDERFDHDCPHCGPLKNENHWGNDVMDFEIFYGDHIIVTPSGEVILEENLKEYLEESLGFLFKTAE